MTVNKKISRIIVSLLIFIILLIPVQSHAYLGVADIVFDPTQFAQMIKDSIKEFAADSFAWAIAKNAVQKLTAQTVNWINSGFNGNPAFVTDPQGFFLNLGDDEISRFISGSPLSQLCSPFQAGIRLALVKTYLAETAPKYACTLGDIKENFQNFTSDFREGGWDSWFNVSQNSQSNPYGSYLNAQQAISINIQASKSKYEKQLDWGGGFLSYERCPAGHEVKKCLGTQGQERVEICPDGKPPFNGVGGSCAFGEKPTSTWKQLECIGASEIQCDVPKETVTPGSVISNQLNKQLGAGTDSLVSADEINEIIGALFNQLVSKVVGGGGGLRSGTVKAQDRNTYFYEYQTPVVNYPSPDGTVQSGIICDQSGCYAKEGLATTTTSGPKISVTLSCGMAAKEYAHFIFGYGDYPQFCDRGVPQPVNPPPFPTKEKPSTWTCVSVTGNLTEISNTCTATRI